MPKPQDVTQLRAFLGMVQYYSKFLPDLATHLALLHRLLQKEVKWSWGAEEETSFPVVKGMLLRDKVLIHYDPELPLVLTTQFLVWSGCCLVTPSCVRRGAAHSSRIPVSVRNREEVLTNWERGLIPGLGCEEVSNLPGGSSFYPGYRSSIPNIHGSGEGCASGLSSKDTGLVPVSGCLFLPDWVPRLQAAC